ncbi:MAG: hypothetical protein K0R57_5832 [Paenibacillaceae bacterium]|jgi:hypothetical protein|nr:hypothetical protein [Paenibacillaceae bacterium]
MDPQEITKQNHPPKLWKKLLQELENHTGILGHKIESWEVSRSLYRQASPMLLTDCAIADLHREWSRMLADSPVTADEGEPSTVEQAAYARIIRRTEAANRNNVTRAAAYYEVYRQNPELHWAMLAHMVSRNGGWAMTDLEGEHIPHLLEPHYRRDIFLFLERANALIFQDAYPQLLLYAESKHLGQSLFRLLPRFHVSAFMQPVWDRFMQDRDPVPLTVCLIINEQNYIEGRVVRSRHYRKHVLETPAFRTQFLSQTNQVFFPYQEQRTESPRSTYRLAGLVLEDFSDLEERIGFGKKLYAILFGIPRIRKEVEQFAIKQPHTGSRADYDNRLFTCNKKASSPDPYAKKLEGYGLQDGASPLYSPVLQEAWEDHPVEAIERYDWFTEIKGADAFTSVTVPRSLDMTAEACFGLRKLELAVLALQLVR